MSQSRSYRRGFSARASASTDAPSSTESPAEAVESSSDANGAVAAEAPQELALKQYPSGEMVFEKIEGFGRFMQSVRMFFAWPWQKFKKGSVLTMTLSGPVSPHVFDRLLVRSVNSLLLCPETVGYKFNRPSMSGPKRAFGT
jgi:protease-4